LVQRPAATLHRIKAGDLVGRAWRLGMVDPQVLVAAHRSSGHRRIDMQPLRRTTAQGVQVGRRQRGCGDRASTRLGNPQSGGKHRVDPAHLGLAGRRRRQARAIEQVCDQAGGVRGRGRRHRGGSFHGKAQSRFFLKVGRGLRVSQKMERFRKSL
jgi:hypothetical protein